MWRARTIRDVGGLAPVMMVSDRIGRHCPFSGEPRSTSPRRWVPKGPPNDNCARNGRYGEAGSEEPGLEIAVDERGQTQGHKTDQKPNE